MSEQLILNVVGHPKAGKSTTVKHLETKGFTPVKPSLIIAEFAHQQNLPLDSREDYLQAHRRLLAERPYAIVEPILDIKTNVIYDGLRVLRHMDMLRHYGRKVGNVSVASVALYCPLEERYNRQVAAPDPRWQDLTFQQFHANELGDYFSPDVREANVLMMMYESEIKIDTTQPQDIWLAELDGYLDPIC